MLITHHAIKDFPIRDASDIIGKDMVDITLSILTRDKDLAHMTHIEHTTMLAHCLMFVYNIGILDWHVEATKRRYQSSKCDMFVIETGLFVFHIYLFS